MVSSNSQQFLSQENLRQTEKSMLLASSHSIHHPDAKAKFITVTNSRALEFLIDNDHVPDPYTVPTLNRSGFAKSKKLRFLS
jgi:hypothetical protein